MGKIDGLEKMGIIEKTNRDRNYQQTDKPSLIAHFLQFTYFALF